MLQLTNVSHSYSGNSTIQNVSLDLDDGKILTILGENGSGKSTLLKLIAGLLTPDSGKIIFNKQKVKGPDEQLIPGHPKIKLIFQDFKLAHRTTVKENIISLLPPIKEEFKEEKTSKLLSAFKLDHLATKKVEALSGGEKQRLAIARALADEPELVLMDEPFSSLDALTKKKITNVLFDALQTLSLSAVIVTHDYTEALKYSDYIGVLKSGKLIQLDLPENVYFSPVDAYSAELTGPVNIIKPESINDLLNPKKTLYIRPNQIIVGENGAFPATVASVKFAGPFYEVKLTIENGTTFITLLGKELLQGEKVFISFKT